MDLSKIPVGVNPPYDVNAIIEIPQGGEPVKDEIDKESGALFVDRFLHTAFVPGEHDFASFTHLTGYASNYYTYVFDKVIALDFFAQFDPKDLLGGPAGLRYRQSVLAPGSTRPAGQLVHDFLGRDTNLDAYRRWMLEEFAAPAAAAH